MSNPINPREQPNPEQVKAALSQQLIQLIERVKLHHIDSKKAFTHYEKVGETPKALKMLGCHFAYGAVLDLLKRYLDDIRR